MTPRCLFRDGMRGRGARVACRQPDDSPGIPGCQTVRTLVRQTWCRGRAAVAPRWCLGRAEPPGRYRTPGVRQRRGRRVRPLSHTRRAVRGPRAAPVGRIRSLQALSPHDGAAAAAGGWLVDRPKPRSAPGACNRGGNGTFVPVHPGTPGLPGRAPRRSTLRVWTARTGMSRRPRPAARLQVTGRPGRERRLCPPPPRGRVHRHRIGLRRLARSLAMARRRGARSLAMARRRAARSRLIARRRAARSLAMARRRAARSRLMARRRGARLRLVARRRSASCPRPARSIPTPTGSAPCWKSPASSPRHSTGRPSWRPSSGP